MSNTLSSKMLFDPLLDVVAPKYASVSSERSPSEALNLSATDGKDTDPVNAMLPSLPLLRDSRITPRPAASPVLDPL